MILNRERCRWQTNAPVLLLCALTWLSTPADAHACKCGSPDIRETTDLAVYTVFVGTAVEMLQWHDGCSWAPGFAVSDFPGSFVGTAYRFAVRASIDRLPPDELVVFTSSRGGEVQCVLSGR